MEEKNNICIPSYLKFSPAYNDIYPNKIKLPTKLNANGDSSKLLKVSEDGLTIFCKGDLRYSFVGSITANHYVPPEVGLYYYELNVTDKGMYGIIGLGFCGPNIRSDLSMPGWDYKSYGYHGDDGYKFASSGKGSSYGPTYTTGDIVGVGVNFFNNTMFFTKNGIHLGTAFTHVESNVLYPVIGVRGLRECFVNFGQQQFVFDIDQYIQKVINEVSDENGEPNQNFT